MRRALGLMRACCERAAVTVCAPHAERLLRSAQVHVLCFHDLKPGQEAAFERMISGLANRLEIVPYASATQQIASGSSTRPTLAITFDDGLRRHLDAARLLATLGVSACFFVCSDWIGIDDAGAAEACSTRLRIPPAPMLNADELREIQDLGHEIGCHSASHRDMGTLSGSELAREARDARARIEVEIGTIQHFAWPYGRFARFSHAARHAVIDAGFTSIASAERGCHVGHEADLSSHAHASPPCIRRELAEPDEPVDRLLSRLALRRMLSRTRGQWPRSYAR